ncbi:MAG: thermonuclease family protein [Azoarcus sp.]|nr:thermonuclease family protein [Azoarcus sp.]
MEIISGKPPVFLENARASRGSLPISMAWSGLLSGAFAGLLLFVISIGLALAAPTARKQVGTVVAVADGDTLTLRNKQGRRIVVRLAEIDAPEKCQRYGAQARRSLIELALNQRATVEVIDIDQYGRSVGRVRIDGSAETVNRIQLRRGFAWYYARYAKDTSLKALERQAAAARRGLWADKKPQAPWTWRRQHPGRSGCK